MRVDVNKTSAQLRLLLDQQITWGALARLVFTLDFEGWVDTYVLTPEVQSLISLQRLRFSSYFPPLVGRQFAIWTSLGYPVLKPITRKVVIAAARAAVRVFQDALTYRGRPRWSGWSKSAALWTFDKTLRVGEALWLAQAITSLPNARERLVDTLTEELT